MKNVAILGSTGSVGINTLKVIESLSGSFRVVGLSSFSNVNLLEKQIKRFKPSLITVVDPKSCMELKSRIGRRPIKLFSTTEGLNIIASSKDVDIVVIAVSGSTALYPLLAAIKSRKHICLANKESIVMAGEIVMEKVRRNRVRLIPVDSEHNAIFQCLGSDKPSRVNRIFLTGSGGPLLRMAKHRFSSLKVSQVLKHPKWKMGKKITVDSATLINKGLEMIEAQHLFNVSIDKIKLLIHPEAVIHSMVEFVDGTIIAQLGVTDMRLPIQYALTYPERVKTALSGIDFSSIGALNFRCPDHGKYPCLSLAMVAARLGGTYPAVLNASDEVTVEAFLKGDINFIKIAKIIEKVLMRHTSIEKPTLYDIIQSDRWAREEAHSLC